LGGPEPSRENIWITAINGGRRAAQHFDAVSHVEVQRGRLALAIRGAGRDPVAEQLDATDAEGRAGAIATRRYLQVLGVVLAVLHHQARYAVERFRQVDAQLAIGNLPAFYGVDGVGQVEARVGGVGAGDHHRFQQIEGGDRFGLGQWAQAGQQDDQGLAAKRGELHAASCFLEEGSARRRSR